MTKMIGPSEVAKILGVTRQAVYLAITNKRLKARKGSAINMCYAANRWLIDEADIKEYRKSMFSRDKSLYKGELLYDVKKGSYSLRKAAEYLNIKYGTLYYYIQKGHIEAKRKGAAWILMKDDLDFLRKQLDELND